MHETLLQLRGCVRSDYLAASIFGFADCGIATVPSGAVGEAAVPRNSRMVRTAAARFEHESLNAPEVQPRCVPFRMTNAVR